MFSVSNYHQQSESLPVESNWQIVLFKSTDKMTRICYVGKILTLITLAASVASYVFGHDAPGLIKCFIYCAAATSFATLITKFLELKSEEVIERLKKQQQGYDHIIDWTENLRRVQEDDLRFS